MASDHGVLTPASGAKRLVAMSELLCLLPFALMITTVAGGVIGLPKNCALEGMALGLFLGPFGVIAAGFLEQRPKCPACGTRLNLAGGGKGYPHCPSCKSRLEWHKNMPSLAPQRPKTPAGV